MLESLLIKYEEALEGGSYYELRSIQNEVIDYMQNCKRDLRCGMSYYFEWSSFF